MGFLRVMQGEININRQKYGLSCEEGDILRYFKETSFFSLFQNNRKSKRIRSIMETSIQNLHICEGGVSNV